MKDLETDGVFEAVSTIVRTSYSHFFEKKKTHKWNSSIIEIWKIFTFDHFCIYRFNDLGIYEYKVPTYVRK